MKDTANLPINSSTNTRASNRRRSSRGKLRRSTPLDGNVIVEEPFTFHLPNSISNNNKETLSADVDSSDVGDGCYVSCTVNRTRYYGVLVDQNALTAASTLYFKNEADSLDLNRRMRHLYNQQQQQQQQQHQRGGTKRPRLLQPQDISTNNNNITAVTTNDNFTATTSTKTIADVKPDNIGIIINDSNNNSSSSKIDETNRTQVHKYKFIPPDNKTGGPGYRTLLATYTNAHAAAEDDDKVDQILKACKEGGNFVGWYYYQFVTTDDNKFLKGTQAFESGHTLQQNNDIMLRTSLNLGSFFQNTVLPPWYPLSNINGFSQTKVLNILKLKKKENGELEFNDEDNADEYNDVLVDHKQQQHCQATTTPKDKNTTVVYNLNNNDDSSPPIARKGYRIGVLGGGIAGLACAAEILRLAERAPRGEDNDKIKNLQVVLLEGRNRVGGRLHTDNETFAECPVDLGAGWIHGIDGNPITDLAREAGITLVPTAEDVKLLSCNMQEADQDADKKMTELFDHLLDQGAEHCWQQNEIQQVNNITRRQKVIRWYGSTLSVDVEKFQQNIIPIATDVPIHRHSTDISVDHALGLFGPQSLQREELRLLHWNTKNVEYALGADISSLSMKFWSSDEDHAFHGQHVLLKEGYSKVSELLLQRCNRRKNNFELKLNFPIGKIEYSRKQKMCCSPSTPQQLQQHHTKPVGKKSSLVEISNMCSVTSQDGKSSHEFDFLVCTLPLGVLKNSADALPTHNTATGILSSSADALSNQLSASDKVVFCPALPMPKRDAIESVGFGVLNKIYLQFPFAFWRRKGSKESLRNTPFLGEEQQSFGNVSGINPHHYIFYDVGNIMSSSDNNDESRRWPPPILLTLVSGCEAVRIELLSDEAVIKEVMLTLVGIYTDVEVPQPICTKITKWGSDTFSRGCYSFLPPGATNEDYTILQLPINENGDKYSSRNLETMRLFWAGEHTASLHPSMSHGALLSGIRAAEEVIKEMHVKTQHGLSDFENPVPVSIYRMKHPLEPLVCQLCNKIGSRKQEGALVAFQKGAKQALVHLNCATYSPEVCFNDDNWKNVLKAISRGRLIKCSKCQRPGASIGCNLTSCPSSYHFSCCEEEGWSFERDGKTFFCRQHREHANHPNAVSKPQAFEKKTSKLPFELPVGNIVYSRELLPNQAIQHDLISDAATTALASPPFTKNDSSNNARILQEVESAVNHRQLQQQ